MNKILLILVTILLITIGTNNLVNGTFFNREYRLAIEKEIVHIGEDVKQQLERILSLGIPIKDVFQFDEITREVVLKYPEVAHALVLDKDGELLFHGSKQRPEIIQFGLADYKTGISSGEASYMEIRIEEYSYYAALIPVVSNLNSVQGGVMIAVSNDYIQSKMNKFTVYSVLQFILFFFASFILLALMLSRWVTKPLHRIMAVMTDAGAGNLNVRVSIVSKDEFGTLGRKLNLMLDQIKELMQAKETANRLQMEYIAERERSRLSEMLRRAMLRLSGTLDVNRVQVLSLEEMLAFVSYDRASIWVEEEGSLVERATIGQDERMDPIPTDVLKEIYGQLKRSGSPRLDRSDETGQYRLSIPYDLNGKITGVQVLERFDREFEPSEAEIARNYSSHATIAISNAMLYRQMERMAITDELTGMHNRRYFYLLAQQAIQHAEENREPLSFILFDIDYFKQVNDKYGHLIGDEVLRSIAPIVNESLQLRHVTARFGGEEFVVLLPGSDGERAAQAAEAMRARVRAHELETEQGILRVSISAGVSDWRPGDHMDSLLQRADEALYTAKSQGRDRVIVHGRRPIE